MSERPTAAIRRVDVSALARGASAVRSEDALFHGYSRMGQPRIEARPCVCGGYVHADPVRPARGVAAHQYTGRHLAWRAAQEA